MGLLMERNSAVSTDNRRRGGFYLIKAVYVARYIIIAFRPEKETVLRKSTLYKCDMLEKFRMGRLCGKIKIAGTSLRIETESNGDGFEKG